MSAESEEDEGPEPRSDQEEDEEDASSGGEERKGKTKGKPKGKTKGKAEKRDEILDYASCVFSKTNLDIIDSKFKKKKPVEEYKYERNHTFVSRIIPMVFQQVPNVMISYLNFLRYQNGKLNSTENIQTWVLGKTQDIFYDYISGPTRDWPDLCDNVFMFKDKRILTAPETKLTKADAYLTERFPTDCDEIKDLDQKESFVVDKFKYTIYAQNKKPITYVLTEPCFSEDSEKESFDKLRKKINKCTYITFYNGVPDALLKKDYCTVYGIVPQTPDWDKNPQYFLIKSEWKVSIHKKSIKLQDGTAKNSKAITKITLEKKERIYTCYYALSEFITFDIIDDSARTIFLNLFGARKDIWALKN